MITGTLSCTPQGLRPVTGWPVMAALIAAQCPGGEPVGTVYGPRQPLPAFPHDLRGLAAEAWIESWPTSQGCPGWGNPADARQWLSSVKGLRDVLDPPPALPDTSLVEP